MLSERIKALTGPDRGIDAEIGDLLWQGKADDQPCNVFDCYQSYTASIDAAMTLVPDCYGAIALEITTSSTRAAIGDDGEGGFIGFAGSAATPALALTAAALRSRGL